MLLLLGLALASPMLLLALVVWMERVERALDVDAFRPAELPASPVLGGGKDASAAR